MDHIETTTQENTPDSPAVTCSFCGKSQEDVTVIVTGKTGNICNECAEGAAALAREKEYAPPPNDLAATVARAAAASRRAAPPPRPCSDDHHCGCKVCAATWVLWTDCQALRDAEDAHHPHASPRPRYSIEKRTVLRERLAKLAARAAERVLGPIDAHVLTDETIRFWAEKAAEEQREAAAAREAARPLKMSLARRKSATEMFASVIPSKYAPAMPIEAGETPQQQRAYHDGLFSPDERGRVRVKDRQAYKAAMDAAVGIANGSVATVLLVGPSGAGKTHLAALMLRRITLEWERNAERGVGKALAAREIPAPRDIPEWCMDMADEMSEDGAGPPPIPSPTRFVAEAVIVEGDPVFKRLTNEAMGYRRAVAWEKSRDLFRAAVSPKSFPKNGEDAADPLETAKKAPVAVLEDIGGEPKQANVSPVEDVVWERYDNDDVATIVTTGFCEKSAPRPDDAGDVLRFLAPLAARYGDAFVRRVSEPGVSVVIPVGCDATPSALPKPRPRAAA